MSPVAASGLRPAAAFVGVAFVLSLVALRSSWLHVFAEGEQPDANRVDASPVTEFHIADRDGRTLAASVECFDLTVSPRSMWRSHTPDHMARRIAAVLDDPDGERWTDRRVLERSMPYEFAEGLLPGRIAPASPRLVWFEETDLTGAREWLREGEPPSAKGRADQEERDGAPIRGLSLVARERDPKLHGEGPRVEESSSDAAPVWTLAIEPVACLSKDSRAEQLPTRELDDGTIRVAAPERWTRRLLDDLIAVLGRERIVERFSADEREHYEHLGNIERREFLRDALWAELMPTRFRVIASAVDPVRSHALRELMDEEAVSPWQVELIPRTERRHPTRPGGVPVAPDPEADFERTNDAFSLLGHWGVLDRKTALARAKLDRDTRPHVLPWEDAADPFEAYRQSLVVDQRPWSGIELLCRTELENGPWSLIAAASKPREHTYRLRHVARDRRRAWKDGVPNYFVSAADGTEVPEVEVTIDAHLQEELHAELARLMDVHDPAMAMGIIVDVENGDVLALSSRSAYAYSGFPPLLHVFTPGSTFKAIVMALALDAGVVTPGDEFRTYAAQGGIHLGRRVVREAEGAPQSEWITASEGLAHSVNAVLVQIALRMDAADLRERILRLGYAQPPGAGLGPERSGAVPRLKKGTWSRNYEHASVGFGHEIGTTLWQHATALATLLRGGEHRPLRLVRSISRGEEVWDRDVAPGERVIGAAACERVREMMAIGAREGTGRHVGTAEDNPEFDYLGTKTGTTEKVASELCVHLELAALAEASRTKSEWTNARRAALFDLRKPHRRRSCYTSSMCAVGRIGDREIMVLVVADDARGKERFGSKVTGPSTLALLRRAFDLEPQPSHDVVALAGGPSRADMLERPGFEGTIDTRWLDEDLPWAQGEFEDDVYEDEAAEEDAR